MFNLCPYAIIIWSSMTQKLTNNKEHESSNAMLEQRAQDQWKDEALQEHKLSPASSQKRTIIEPVINMDIPWDLFDGVNQGELCLGGVEVVIQLSA